MTGNYQYNELSDTEFQTINNYSAVGIHSKQ